jgi:transposase
MEHHAVIDVSLEWISVCVVDVDGRSCVRPTCGARAALATFFAESSFSFARIELEAEPLSQSLSAVWLSRATGDLKRDPASQGGA